MRRCGRLSGQSCPCHRHDRLRLRPSQQMSGNSRGVPPIVYDVIRSPGQPLDGAARADMERHFAHDFSGVRVHTDARATASAEAIGAVAYAAGHHLVFAAGKYGSGTSGGRLLLAHELAHVVQQSDSKADSGRLELGSPTDDAEYAAEATADHIAAHAAWSPLGAPQRVEPRIRRTIGHFDCAPGVNGAPADPLTAVTEADGLASVMAQMVADSIAADAATARTGIPAAPSTTFRTYRDRFGLPIAEGSGFLNRLTGTIRPALEIAMSEELAILTRRFALVARLFTEPINYFCPATAATVFNLPPWAPGSCGAADAASSPTTVALCQGFWTNYDASDFSRAAILIHEGFHMIWDRPGGGPGQIGDETQRGPGRNFNVAGCYEGFVDDFFGINSGVACPAVP